VAHLLARRLGSRLARDAGFVVAVLLVVCLLSMSQIRGAPLPYLYFWLRPLTIATFVLPATLALALVARRVGARAPTGRAASWSLVGPIASIVLVLAVSVPVVVGAIEDEPSLLRRLAGPTEALVDQVEAEGGVPSGGVIVRLDGDGLGGLQGGLVDELDRQGEPVFVDEAGAFQFGDQRGRTPDDVDEVWYALESRAAAEDLVERYGGEEIARYEPLGPEAEARTVELRELLASRLPAGDRATWLPLLETPYVSLELGDDLPDLADELQELADLNQEVQEAGSCPCSIVRFPAASAPDFVVYGDDQLSAAPGQPSS
jgi:hypothetical protein